MSLEDYRVSLATAVVAAAEAFELWPNLDIETDNNRVMKPSEEVPHLCVEIKYAGAKQADLSNNPRHRIVGFVVLTAKAKAGTGSLKANQLLDHFYTRLHFRKIGDMVLEMASVEPNGRTVGSWWAISALIPFRVDRTYN